MTKHMFYFQDHCFKLHITEGKQFKDTNSILFRTGLNLCDDINLTYSTVWDTIA